VTDLNVVDATDAGGSDGSFEVGLEQRDGERPVEVLTGGLETRTLTPDRDYVLRGMTIVPAGRTLTISAGVVIKAEPGSKAVLVVHPLAQILAVGTAASPIVFTSGATSPKAGDWGGLVLLGNAPISHVAATADVEGFLTGEATFGGNDSVASSGSLKYVRIEYSGMERENSIRLNGLTLAGIGVNTKLDFIQVRHTGDDCFEFLGGNVNASHLACQWPADDGIDWDLGYVGRIQFFVMQQLPTTTTAMAYGLEGDGLQDGASGPVSEPRIINATLCGQGQETAGVQQGLGLRRGARGWLMNIAVQGFESCVCATWT
jgi:hypothetical protein